MLFSEVSGFICAGVNYTPTICSIYYNINYSLGLAKKNTFPGWKFEILLFVYCEVSDIIVKTHVLPVMAQGPIAVAKTWLDFLNKALSKLLLDLLLLTYGFASNVVLQLLNENKI